jgi:hypothetical protein
MKTQTLLWSALGIGAAYLFFKNQAASTGSLTGLGLITGSNFYTPQVNEPGSMASFYTPAGVTAAVRVPAPVTTVPAPRSPAGSGMQIFSEQNALLLAGLLLFLSTSKITEARRTR